MRRCCPDPQSGAFAAEGIDQILQGRTEKRQIGGRAGNTFSVATFAVGPSVSSAATAHSSQAWPAHWLEPLALQLACMHACLVGGATWQEVVCASVAHGPLSPWPPHADWRRCRQRPLLLDGPAAGRRRQAPACSPYALQPGLASQRLEAVRHDLWNLCPLARWLRRSIFTINCTPGIPPASAPPTGQPPTFLAGPAAAEEHEKRLAAKRAPVILAPRVRKQVDYSYKGQVRPAPARLSHPFLFNLTGGCAQAMSSRLVLADMFGIVETMHQVREDCAARLRAGAAHRPCQSSIRNGPSGCVTPQISGRMSRQADADDLDYVATTADADDNDDDDDVVLPHVRHACSGDWRAL